MSQENFRVCSVVVPEHGHPHVSSGRKHDPWTYAYFRRRLEENFGKITVIPNPESDEEPLQAELVDPLTRETITDSVRVYRFVVPTEKTALLAEILEEACKEVFWQKYLYWSFNDEPHSYIYYPR